MAVQTSPSFAPTGQAALLATTTSARVAIANPTTSSVIMVTNFGAYPAFIVLGDVTSVATVASGTPVLPMGGTSGGQTFLSIGTNTYVAAITAFNSTELRITTGT